MRAGVYCVPLEFSVPIPFGSLKIVTPKSSKRLFEEARFFSQSSHFSTGPKTLVLSRDEVMWSRKCTSKMANSITPLHEKVCNQTAWIRVLLVLGSMLICHMLIFS